MTHKTHHPPAPATAKRGTFFSKAFRWQSAKPGDPKPHSVEIAGTFTGWKPVALAHDPATHHWQVMIHHIPGNCTHHYILLVDGQPASYKDCDGLAVPVNEVEKRFALQTPRGPRVFMLFSNTK
ncbi:MAG TPA: hypothetical protein VMV89_09095 [Candidatus Paceibacterota bacterium]|nr:hypothetical protein [Candidatus Paceibacterota bacterium]